jgi:hypothetical protein
MEKKKYGDDAHRDKQVLKMTSITKLAFGTEINSKCDYYLLSSTICSDFDNFRTQFIICYRIWRLTFLILHLNL